MQLCELFVTEAAFERKYLALLEYLGEVSVFDTP